MAFEFGEINTSVKLKNQNAITKNLSYLSTTGKNRHLLFVLEHPLRDRVLIGSVTRWIQKNCPGFDVDVVSASLINATDEEIKKQGIFRFYKDNCIDFNQFIRPGQTVIVPFGYALSSIIKAPDLSTECFHDFVFNKTYFFAPQVGCYVFPIDSVEDLFKPVNEFWFPKDSSRVMFALMQIHYIDTMYEKLRKPPAIDRLSLHMLHTKADWNDFYKKVKFWDSQNQADYHNKLPVSWDLETTGLHFRRSRVLEISFSFDGRQGYHVPWNIVNPEQLEDFFKDRYQIGQNLKFDCKMLKSRGISTVKVDSDTLQLGQLLNEMRFNGLKSLAYHYTRHGGYDYDLDDFVDHYHPRDYSEIPDPLRARYSTEDAVLNFQIERAMQTQLSELDEKYKPVHDGGWSMRDLYEKVKIPSVNSFIDIELRGVYVNPEKWNTNAQIVQEKITGLKEALRKHLFIKEADDIIFSLDSDDIDPKKKDTLQSGMKLGIILKNLGWEDLGHAKAGYYLTGDDQLERWKNLGHGEAELIQDLRSYLTLQKTFIGRAGDDDLGWKSWIEHYPDGSYRIHPNYKAMLMATMRNGCAEPNYQQSPSSAKDAILFKQVFTTPDPKKYYLVNLDYSGFQMRLAAIDSEDPVLFKAYKENPNLDLHTKTGYNVFAKDVEFDIEEIVIEEGSRRKVVFPHEQITVIRDNQKVKIKAKDLVETDKLT